MNDVNTPRALVPIVDFVAAGGSPGVSIPRYDRAAVTVGQAHIGVGNFHRVHQGTYLDDLLGLRPDQARWGLRGIELLEAPDRADALRAQDSLYTLTVFSPQGGGSSRVIGSMVDYVYAPADPAAVVRALADRAVRVVTLTVTEGGYHLDEHTGAFRADDPVIAADLRAEHPRTTFGVLTAALGARRDARVEPFTIASCDNLRSNGRTARTATVGYAEARDPELARWIEGNVAFPNSMVDRIAPTVDASVRDRLNGLTGVADGAPVLAEDFRQWVLEDTFPAGRPAWEDVGVQLRGDVDQFEAIKGRLLNASHSLLAYPAVLAGYERISQAASDPLLADLLRTFMAVDVAPQLTPPAGVALGDYQEMIVLRFTNPNVPDTVLRVAHDGAAKLPVFHRSTAEGLLTRGGDPRREALLLATFRGYVAGVDEKGAAFEVGEPHLGDADRALLLSTDPLDTLAAGPFAAWRLAESEPFVKAYLAAVETLRSAGVHAAVRQALGR